MSVESPTTGGGPPMPGAEVRRRVAAGAVVLAARGTAVRIIAFGGNIVLARLLVPEDFGLVALGLVAYQFAGLLTDAGIGAALIRRAEPPNRAELRSVLGFQLLVTTLIAGGTLITAVLIGQGALIVALMLAGIPMMAFGAPGSLLLERDLAYRPLATAEILQTLAYYAWAVATVALGFGVWGFASASIVHAVVGSTFLVAVSPIRVLLPALRWSRVKPLFAFGVRFQAAQAVKLTKDLAFNAGVAALAGITTLGLWTLALKILRVPYLLFESLWRVSYPGMSRLIDAGESPAPAIERSTCLVALGAGAMYAPLIASAPALVPAAFGAEWSPVADVIPTAGLALMISGPISAAATGYLYATGEAGFMLKITVFQSVIALVLGLPLVSTVGIAALGFTWLGSALVVAAIFSRAIKRRVGVGLISPVAIPLTVATVAAAGGWAIAARSDPSLLLALETVVLSEVLFWSGIAATRRPAMRDFFRLGRRGIRSAVVRSPG
jgi:O-antigen/teichoic acid export membrane protein